MKGVFRIAAVMPEHKVGDVDFNTAKIIEQFDAAAEKGAAIVLFPELSVTGCSCGDLFAGTFLTGCVHDALRRLCHASSSQDAVLIAGLPLLHRGRLYNAAAVIRRGKILGITAKNFLSNDRKRYFCSGAETDGTGFLFDGMEIPFGNRLLFESPGLAFGIETGSDAYAVYPPSAGLALDGAQLICNLWGEPEVAGSAAKRRALVSALSSRLHCFYALAGAGIGESGTETLFAGDAIFGNCGKIESEMRNFGFESKMLFSDFLPHRADAVRRRDNFYDCAPQTGACRVAVDELPHSPDAAFLHLRKNPFIPEFAGAERAQEILRIQSLALARRVRQVGAKRLVLGLSGGLDSTLSLLVCVLCCDALKLERSAILAVTMPGFGTSSRTRENAEELAKEFGAELRIIPIADAVTGHFRDIGHDPAVHNVAYENSQARERTQILMDLANDCGGIVIGTGDLSEIALGWATYNGDQMSMYGTNGSIPKTLVRFLVSAYADNAPEAVAAHLRDVVETPVSPELLPGAQHTEKLIGSYELHDFFIWNFLKYGEDMETLRELAHIVFRDDYSGKEIDQTLGIFRKRFFSQQFKRNPMPDGAKAGALSLSPRGDWMMPSDCTIPL